MQNGQGQGRGGGRGRGGGGRWCGPYYPGYTPGNEAGRQNMPPDQSGRTPADEQQQYGFYGPADPSYGWAASPWGSPPPYGFYGFPQPWGGGPFYAQHAPPPGYFPAWQPWVPAAPYAPPPPPPVEQELSYLKEQESFLQEELKQIRRRIEDLTSTAEE